MLLPNLIPLIDVTFSTPTGRYTSMRFSFAFLRDDEFNRDLQQLAKKGDLFRSPFP